MLLRKILQELDEVPEIGPGPSAKMCEGEVELGVLNDDLKRLYMLREFTRKRFEQKFKDFMHQMVDSVWPHARSEPDLQLSPELRSLGEQLELIDTIFWAEIRTAFVKTPSPNGTWHLREGWKVVWQERAPGEKINLVIQSLFPTFGFRP